MKKRIELQIITFNYKCTSLIRPNLYYRLYNLYSLK